MEPIELPEFTTKESDTGIIFTINSGAYEGTEYQYGVVSLAEPSPGQDQASLKFTFSIFEDSGITDLNEDIGFIQTIGKILETVINGLSPEPDDNTTIEEVEFVDTTDELQKIL